MNWSDLHWTHHVCTLVKPVPMTSCLLSQCRAVPGTWQRSSEQDGPARRSESWTFPLPVQFSHSVVSDSLRPHELQHARPPCPSPTPRVYSNSCPLSQWCHSAISSFVIPFSSWPQSLPASGSFPVSQLFAWGVQSTGVSASASVLPMNTQDWSPLGPTAKTPQNGQIEAPLLPIFSQWNIVKRVWHHECRKYTKPSQCMIHNLVS